MSMDRGATDLAAVLAAQAGDADAFGRLYLAWFDRVHDVVRRITRDPHVADEVTQDVFLDAYRKLDTLRSPDAFGGWLLRSARNRALNRIRHEQRSVAVDPGGDDDVSGHPLDRGTGYAVDERFAADENDELVRAAAAALGEADAGILHLHLRHGLDGAELAEELGVEPNAVHQRLFRLRKRLADAIRSWQLWRHGRPRCPALRVALEAQAVAGFDAATAKIIDRHASACDECDDERRRSTAPAALFAAVPVLLVPAVAKAEVARGLVEAGVPLPPEYTDPAFVEAASTVPDGPHPVSDGRRGARSARRIAVLAVAAVALVAVSLAVWAAPTGHDPDRSASGPEGEAFATGPLAGDLGRSDGAGTSGVDVEVVDPSDATSTTAVTSTDRVPTGSDVAPADPTSPDVAVEQPDPVPIPVDDPPTTPPAGAPSSSTTTVPPAPEVVRFSARRIAATGDCRTPSSRIVVTWATSGATSVTLTAPDGTRAVAAEGTTVVCHATAGRFALEATGPGGTSTAGPIVVSAG
ncbi:MAG: sigma-70 family RNA polymerase sigma factor [Actinobacteria bacterium]|nr:sigma-70 family RNA polymerase sigma factor [Actinomycetota bacterium]